MLENVRKYDLELVNTNHDDYNDLQKRVGNFRTKEFIIRVMICSLMSRRFQIVIKNFFGQMVYISKEKMAALVTKLDSKDFK